MVLCTDEKSQIQALNRFGPVLSMMPGTQEPRNHDYVRHGTTSPFAALDMTTGKVIGSQQLGTYEIYVANQRLGTPAASVGSG